MPTPRLGLLVYVVPRSAFAVLAACTTKVAPKGAAALGEQRQCFLASNVIGFTPVNDRTVDVRVRASDVYRLELSRFCPDIDWTQAVAVRSRGSSWICRGLDAELVVPSAIGRQRRQVATVRKLSEAEVEAARAPTTHTP